MAGLLPDGLALLKRARIEAANYREFYKAGIVGNVREKKKGNI
jgi:ribosome modulation factor